MGKPPSAALLAFLEYCRLDGAAVAMTLVRDGRDRERRLVLRYCGDDLARGYGVEIDYMSAGGAVGLGGRWAPDPRMRQFGRRRPR